MLGPSLCRRIVLLILLAGIAFTTKAQEEKFKALFIYNFTKHVNWPPRPGNFVICIVGNSSVLEEIESIALKKTVGSTPIEITKANSAEELPECHIVYISFNKSALLPQLLQRAKEKNILIITEKSNSCTAGAGINFIAHDGKLVFEISKPNIENCGLKVSSELLKLGYTASK